MAQCEAVCQCCVIMSSVHFINKCRPVPAHGLTSRGSKEVIIIISRHLNIVGECIPLTITM